MNYRYKAGHDQRDDGKLMPIGRFLHPSATDGYRVAVVENTAKEVVPKFNSPVYNDKGTEVGLIDDVFGPITNHYFTIKPHPNISLDSIQAGQAFHIREGRVIQLSRFTNPPPPPQKQPKQKGLQRSDRQSRSGAGAGARRSSGRPGDRRGSSDAKSYRSDAKKPDPFTYTRDSKFSNRSRQNNRPDGNITRNRFSQGRA